MRMSIRSAMPISSIRTATADERSHQNLVTTRAVGIVSLLTGILLVFIGFATTRRAAEGRAP